MKKRVYRRSRSMPRPSTFFGSSPFFQAKMETDGIAISEPGDKHEVEAEALADSVTTGIQEKNVQMLPEDEVQMQTEEEEVQMQEEEEVQMQEEEEEVQMQEEEEEV